MEYYAAERKKDFIPFATAWMELESIMLSEISQVVKDKYHMIGVSNSFSLPAISALWLPLTHPILGTWAATQACAPTEN